MNKEQVPSSYAFVCFHLIDFRDTSRCCQMTMMGSELIALVDIATLLLTKYWPYNPEDAINTTAINPKWNVNHSSVCAYLLYGRKFLKST